MRKGWKIFWGSFSAICVLGAFGSTVENATNVVVEEDLEVETEDIGEFSLADVPAYSNTAYAVINENVPFFYASDLEEARSSYESYGELDNLGRCGVCVASIGPDIMPTEERGEIGSVKPSGWHTVKYNGIIDGNYLYNRCHLIGYQLTGENANTQNLITGTRYLNVEGMQPFETKVANYVKETGNHVLYRVTPVFEGDNLVATGVLMEAESVEDNGEGIQYNVFCYNVQPGIVIDYASGDSSTDGSLVADGESQTQAETTPTEVPQAETTPAEVLQTETTSAEVPQAETTPTEVLQSEATPAPSSENLASETGSYAVNGKNGKIHIVGGCPATGTGNNAMKNPVYFDTYEEAENYSSAIEPGLEKRKCGNCW